MKYHDNDFQFIGKEGFEVIEGSYTITELCVTQGQDPDRNIQVGTVVPIDKNGKASVRLGRSGSNDTAKWFNDRIPAKNTTFGHSAGKLNFAFLGTLKLYITIKTSGKTLELEYILDDIGIAQGHAGASNNWWFGGKTCKHIGDNSVKVEATTWNKRKVLIEFLRGDNDVNRIGVIPYEFSDWMSGISKDTAINKLIIPGSHDAGMSELHHRTDPSQVFDVYIKTQKFTVENQLLRGSRYLDIRIDFDHGQLVTYHRTDNGIGANGQSLSDVFNNIADFLKKYKSEFVIVKISHIRSDRGAQSDIKDIIELFLDAYHDLLYCDSVEDENVPIQKLTIEKIRGKMIVALDYKEHINTCRGRFRYSDVDCIKVDCKTKTKNLSVYDKYTNTSKYDEMAKDQTKKWKEQEEHIGICANGLFLLSWTLTANPKRLTPGIEALAKNANSKLPGVLDENIRFRKYKNPNIVFIDFLDSSCTSEIVSYNFLLD